MNATLPTGIGQRRRQMFHRPPSHLLVFVLGLIPVLAGCSGGGASWKTSVDACHLDAGTLAGGAGPFSYPALMASGTIRNTSAAEHNYEIEVGAFDGSFAVAALSPSPWVGTVRPGETVTWRGSGRADSSHPLPARPVCKVVKVTVDPPPPMP